MFNPKRYQIWNNTLIFHDMRQDPHYFSITKTTTHARSTPHIHDVYQLWYILRSSCTHTFNGKEYSQGRGNFLIVPPYFEHWIDTSRSSDIQLIILEFSEGFIDSMFEGEAKDSLFNLVYLRPILASSALMNPFLTFDGSTTQRIEKILYELLMEYQNLNDFSTDFIRINLIKLLSLIIREYDRTKTSQSDALYDKYRAAIQSALDYIDEHYAENITLADICKIALMSTTSFSFVFKRITGKTFLEYITQLRIGKACRLLTETDASLTDLCAQCGYYDAPHFAHTFKRITGMTPIQYRKKHLEE